MDCSEDQTTVAASNSPAAKATQLPAHALAYIPAPETGSSRSVTNSDSPFYVRSCNHQDFKYKYPEANPTPDGEDDQLWNKIYTAADSRKYNHHNKNFSESKKYRASGETYTLALTMLRENKIKYAEAVRIAIETGQPIPTTIPRGNPSKMVAANTESLSIVKKEKQGPSESSHTTFGEDFNALSISEKIKADGRARKPLIPTTSATAQTMPSTLQKVATPQSKMSSPAPQTKSDSIIPKKRAMNGPPSKNVTVKKHKPAVTSEKSSTPRPASQTPGPVDASDSEDGDGRVYCICRGPDRHTLMVQCERGCLDWFHFECVGITKEDAATLLDLFVCPNCTTDTLQTIFKRICRFNRVGQFDKSQRECRKPARVKENSKYCSDECRNAYWDWVINNLLRQDDEPSKGGRLNRREFFRLMSGVGGSIEKFKQLGQRPRLPADPFNEGRHPGMDFTTEEERAAIADLDARKQVLQERLELLDRMYELLDMVLARGDKAAEHLGVDVKTICGYDSRCSMNENAFKKWFNSPEGIAAFKTSELGPPDQATMFLVSHRPVPGTQSTATLPLPPVLQNLCLETFDKSKINSGNNKNCRHMKKDTYWHDVYEDFIKSERKRLKQDINMLKKHKHEIYDDAEEREVMKYYYKNNVTEVFDVTGEVKTTGKVS